MIFSNQHASRQRHAHHKALPSSKSFKSSLFGLQMQKELHEGSHVQVFHEQVWKLCTSVHPFHLPDSVTWPGSEVGDAV
jgi:hypothetical protein